MLGAIKLSVIRLNVTTLSVILLSVVVLIGVQCCKSFGKFDLAFYKLACFYRQKFQLQLCVSIGAWLSDLDAPWG